MKKPIENLIVVGDSLSKESIFKEIPLLEDNTLSSLARLIVNKSPVWYESLLDIIFYTANNLPSSFSDQQYSKFRTEFNLQHYIFNYIYDRVMITSGEPEVSRRSVGKKKCVQLASICEDIASLRRQNITNNSLVILFIGADDITIPSLDISVLVTEYIEKINLLIEYGYANFAIIDTPGIFHGDFAEKIDLFNSMLNMQIELIKQSSPVISIDVLNSAQVLNNSSKLIAQDLETESLYLSSEAHIALANSFYTSIFASKYEFVLPKQILLELFRTRYFDIISQNKASCFAWFYAKPWDKYACANLREIFSHSDPQKKNRTFQVLRQLEWVNQQGDCISTNPLIISSAAYVNSRMATI